MKRCPQCDFLYLDSDQVCDLDGSPLVTPETNTKPAVSEKRRSSIQEGWKTFAMLIIPGVVFGVILFLVYNWVTTQRRMLVSDAVNSAPNLAVSQQPSKQAEPSPIESATAAPETSRSPVAMASPAKRTVPAPVQLSSKPVSTGTEKKRSMIIRLTDGRTIVADEAWRTKDGIWYRVNGVVTLLNPQQVKAIEKAR
ncbi:MAG TPA: hypothetical protein VI750_12660 [Pyrinomonadaceae bacterium]|nr:hypothetical protein [Pyrinomonadaceae bacterium]